MRNPISNQVIVITGASSGIGLCTAREAARQGARVILVSRDERALAQIETEIRDEGGRAMSFPCDVADASAMKRVAHFAIERFGRIDTWINNAGVSIYGRLMDIRLEEKRRLFDVNFWGVVHGCRAALRVMRRQAKGGVIINQGSVLSERAIPLQGIYSASKHAVKAYTDALRMEVEEEGLPVSIVLVKPAAIDTPYYRHAMSRMDALPKPTRPLYSPELVSNALIEMAEHPRREMTVGGAGKLITALGHLMPSSTDFVMKHTMFKGQMDLETCGQSQEGNLYHPQSGSNGKVFGGYGIHPRRHSMSPWRMIGGVMGAVFLAWGVRRVLKISQRMEIPVQATVSTTLSYLDEAA